MLEYHDTSVRVRYAETDQMGVVYHANYLIWFEVGRVELMRAFGRRVQNAWKLRTTARSSSQTQSAATIIRRATMSYCASVLALPRLRIVSFASATKFFANRTIPLLASGETTHVICGRNGKPKRLPEKYREIFGVKSAHSPAESNL